MSDSSHIQRVGFLYHILKNKPADINTLIGSLNKEGHLIKKRQVYKDLLSVKQLCTTNNERLIENPVNGRKKEWFITNSVSKEVVNTQSLVKLNYLKDICPEWLFPIEKKDDLQKLIFEFQRQYGGLSQLSKNYTLKSSEFYHKRFSHDDSRIIQDIYQAILEQKSIRILQINLDAACCSYPKTAFSLIPAQLLYHRGSIYVTGIAERKQVVVYDISQILDYTISKRKVDLRSYLRLLNNEMVKRFGVSENIDNNIYDIDLEFSEITGEYIKKFFWHNTQIFKRKSNTYIMKLNCGINRELVGWIFQWMNNVRVLKPLKLKNMYLQMITSMLELNSSDKPLTYSNVFLKDK